MILHSNSLLSSRDFSLRPLFCEGPVQSVFDIIDVVLNGNIDFRERGTNSSCYYDRGSLGICGAFNRTSPFDPEFQVNVYVVSFQFLRQCAA